MIPTYRGHCNHFSLNWGNSFSNCIWGFTCLKRDLHIIKVYNEQKELKVEQLEKSDGQVIYTSQLARVSFSAEHWILDCFPTKHYLFIYFSISNSEKYMRAAKVRSLHSISFPLESCILIRQQVLFPLLCSFEMTVEINYVIAIAMLSDWLKRLTPVFQQMRSKTKTNRNMYAPFFPRFERVTGNF